ncbi:hypothetical protein F4859DRAFT_508334 [Xylaria cf. heliscus]|nr:hypothetical protein F4859DRAFT_508334 [Xylaria cf. heliscus]
MAALKISNQPLHSLHCSIDADPKSTPFFYFHYTSPSLNDPAGSANHVMNNSVYRIKSISELFTAYTFLARKGWENWDDAVTRYTPELLDANSPGDGHLIENVNSDNATIVALASQISSIGRDSKE